MNKIVLLLLIIITQTIALNAQQQVEDNNNEAGWSSNVVTSISDSIGGIIYETPLNKYTRLTKKHFGSNDAKAIEYSAAGLAEAKIQNDPNKKLYFLKHLGEAYYNIDSLEQAVKISNELLNYSRQLNAKAYEIAANNNLGKTYSKIEFYAKGLNYFKDLLKTSGGDAYLSEQRQALENIATINLVKNDLKSADSAVKKAIDLALQLGDTLSVIENYWKVHQILNLDGKEDTALLILKTNKTLIDTYNKPDLIYKNFTFYHKFYYEKEEYKKALLYADSSLNAVKAEDDFKKLQALAMLNKAKSMFKINPKDKKLPKLLEACTDLGVETNTETDLLDAYELLYILKKSGNKFKEALDYKEMVAQVRDSLNLERYVHQQKNASLRSQITQTENKLQNLFLEKLFEQKINKQITKFNQAMMALLALSLLLLILFWRSIRRKKRYTKELKEKVEEQTADLVTTNKELTRKNYELNKFNYIISHDLKEPIRNIISFTGLAKNKLNGNQNQKDLKDYIDFANTSASQLNILVQDILEFSKNGISDSKKEIINLDTLMQEVITASQKIISEKNATVSYNTLPSITSVKVPLFIIFKNLLENGLKYNQNENPTFEITYLGDGEAHEFLIEDNGIGIEPEYWNKVFDMFARLHSKGVYEGTGLGLANVKKLLMDMNGSIAIKSSELNKGTVFSLKLPKEVLSEQEA